jgi:hypothetical protein
MRGLEPSADERFGPTLKALHFMRLAGSPEYLSRGTGGFACRAPTVRQYRRKLPRGPKKRGRIIKHIEENPVSAGLVSRADHWEWFSAGRQAKPPVPQGTSLHRTEI